MNYIEGAKVVLLKERKVKHNMPEMTRKEIVKEIEKLEKEQDSWTNFSKNGNTNLAYIANAERLNALYAMLPEP